MTNQFLHIFGYALVFKYDDNNKINRVYPARVNFRGFSKKQIKTLSGNLIDLRKKFNVRRCDLFWDMIWKI